MARFITATRHHARTVPDNHSSYAQYRHAPTMTAIKHGERGATCVAEHDRGQTR